jgi:DNA-directed RNA polymerase sigma subunit (sigma70/sigma32)
MKRSTMKKINTELKEKLQYCLDKDFTRNEIARIMNITPAEVSNLATKFKIKTDFRHVFLRRAEKEVPEEYEKQATSISEMTVKLNLPSSTVRKIYNQYGLKKIRKQQKFHRYKNQILTEESFNALIFELKSTQKSLAELARQYRVSRQRVHQIKKKHNIIREV